MSDAHSLVLDATLTMWALAVACFLCGVLFTLAGLVIMLLLRDIRKAVTTLNDYVRGPYRG